MYCSAHDVVENVEPDQDRDRDPIEATTAALQNAVKAATTDARTRKALCDSIADNLVALAEAVRHMA